MIKFLLIVFTFIADFIWIFSIIYLQHKLEVLLIADFIWIFFFYLYATHIRKDCV